MESIEISSGETVVVDDSDFVKVGHFRWFKKGARGSACAIIHGRVVDMHRYILGFETGKSPRVVVKHRNGDKLDNRRANLLVTTSGVTIATSKHSHRFVKNFSGFKGVSRFVKNGKTRWRARAHIDGKEISLGYFDSPGEAARMYDESIIKVYGPIAVTNKSLGLLDNDKTCGELP